MDGRIAALQRKLNKVAGGEINANSPPQMRALFGVKKRDDDRWYTDTGVLLDTTDGGEGSIGKVALRRMADGNDPRAKAILGIRTYTKAKSFLKDHILGHETNGHVYPNYNQTKGENDLGTGTGRFSINDPALQQIPKRDKEIAEITRACFLPDKGQDWACADWAQFEFRWFAHYVNDPALLSKYTTDPSTDFHALVAEITGLPRDAKYAGNTANAKQINLGLVFGMGEGKLAAEMGLEFSVRKDKNGREWLVAGTDAQAKFKQYHDAIPGIRTLLNKAASISRSRGYVKTIMGRHIRLQNHEAYKAGGLVFQGTSADCMKQKMIELHAVAKAQGFRMLLSVHDEVDFSVPPGKKPPIRAIKYILEDFGPHAKIQCRVPIISDINSGKNWAEASLD
jgi:DNA polymerase I-like protein with 3'-5' exonuclease and polymerase domains